MVWQNVAITHTIVAIYHLKITQYLVYLPCIITYTHTHKQINKCTTIPSLIEGNEDRKGMKW